MSKAYNADRPKDFPMEIQGGMLEALGINMYTTLGKCLVEFIANAYDGDASTVDITIPAEEIERARHKVRARAKAEVDAGKRPPFSILLAALPQEVKVTIKDDGHGMAPEEIKTKFLPINRKRRAAADGSEVNIMSESNRRYVMGRKGLGKLAGFGAAERVTIRTKRRGDKFATTFVMDYRKLKDAENLSDVKIPASYEDGLPAKEHGTTVVLSGLKCDAVKYGMDSMSATIADAFFGIDPGEFEIRLNGERVESEKAKYEFLYPEKRRADGMARTHIDIPDIGELPFEYVVKFRRRGDNLKAAQRGARIYCNKRLAAGPSLFDLPTGMHNFHSQSYMECVVRADDLDRHSIDFVNTNRTQLKEDNEVVKTLLEAVTEIMRKALAAHAHFRDEEAERELEENEQASHLKRIVDRLPTKTRTPAKRLLTSLAAQHGVESVEFRQLAPLVIDSMNAGDILIRLIELGSDPGTVQNVANHLRELAEIERSDALKLYRGRRSGITALQKLADKGEELWKKRRIEAELHGLLKRAPWLIRAEYSRYLTSDQDLGKVATAIAKTLGIDGFAPPVDNDGEPDVTRPDLVFVMTDAEAPYVINVVELKSPTLPLEIGHLNQLKNYMRKIDAFITHHLRRPVAVHGYLIGAMPAGDRISEDSQTLLYELRQKGPEANWDVNGIRSLIDRALAVHLDAIHVLEAEAGEEAERIEAAD
jgi:hypothetical protein